MPNVTGPHRGCYGTPLLLPLHLAHTCSSLYLRGKSTNAICSIITNATCICSVITLVKYTKDARAEVCVFDFLVKIIQANSSTNLKESVSFKLRN